MRKIWIESVADNGVDPAHYLHFIEPMPQGGVWANRSMVPQGEPICFSYVRRILKFLGLKASDLPAPGNCLEIELTETPTLTEWEPE